MSERQGQLVWTAVEPTQTSGCQHSEAVGIRWGDPVSAERQAELQGYLDAWEAETYHGEFRGPFDVISGLRLSGAEVFWLAERPGRDAFGFVPNLHLEGADLSGTHLEGANLSRAGLNEANLGDAHLEGANLSFARLEGANLHGARLDGAIVGEAGLNGANLSFAHLERVNFSLARLEGAILFGARLARADLSDSQLEGADISLAHLKGADLSSTRLEGAKLAGANLEQANLRAAWFDSKTVLAGAALDAETHLADIQWGGVGAVNLTQINWSRVRTLGDERGVGFRAEVNQYEQAVRAYRQLAAQLRAQGLSEVADRFLYRAQVWQRRVVLRRGRIAQYLGSCFLDLISGYGYKPMRSFITYALVILAFAAAYFALGGSNGHPLVWNEAIVVSMTAFHGRGFFAAVFQASDPQAAVAAVEAFIGLLIEIVFIATFTQRFFAR